MLTDQLVVIGVSANLEPNHISATFDGECTITATNTRGPKPPDFLKMQGRMA